MATIVRNVERPSLKQSEIVDDIRRKIAAGILPPGSRLPSIRPLAQEYNACNQTTMRAVQHLVESGHIVTKSRSGTFVADNPPTLSNLAIAFMLKPDRGIWSQMLVAWKLEAERLIGIHAGRNRDIRFSFFYLDYEYSAKDDYPMLLDRIHKKDIGGLIFPWKPAGEYMEDLYAPELQRVVLVQPEWELPTYESARARENLTYMTANTTFVRRGLDFLAAEGCRRIAFLNVTRMQDAEGFYATVKKETDTRGMTTDLHLVQATGYPRTEWAVNCIALMAREFRRDKVDALFITDDNLVPHATEGLVRAGVRVPEDILVLSHANFPHVMKSAVPIRYVGYDVRGLINKALDAIFKKQQKETVPGCVPGMVYMDDELPYSLEEEVQKSKVLMEKNGGIDKILGS